MLVVRRIASQPPSRSHTPRLVSAESVSVVERPPVPIVVTPANTNLPVFSSEGHATLGIQSTGDAQRGRDPQIDQFGFWEVFHAEDAVVE